MLKPSLHLLAPPLKKFPIYYPSWVFERTFNKRQNILNN